MTIAILPAAGRSRRMRRPKLLLPFGRSTVVGSLVRSLESAGVVPIVLVVATGDRALSDWGRSHGLAVAYNPRPERGMLSSLVEALAALGGAREVARRGETVLVSPADLPALESATVVRLLTVMDESGAGLVVPTYRGRRGHPLAIAPRLVTEIPSLGPDSGLHQLLDARAREIVEVEVEDPGVVFDIDTPAEYEELRRRFRGLPP